jgi:hypothetical protein
MLKLQEEQPGGRHGHALAALLCDCEMLRPSVYATGVPCGRFLQAGHTAQQLCTGAPLTRTAAASAGRACGLAHMHGRSAGTASGKQAANQQQASSGGPQVRATGTYMCEVSWAQHKSTLQHLNGVMLLRSKHNVFRCMELISVLLLLQLWGRQQLYIHATVRNTAPSSRLPLTST